MTRRVRFAALILLLLALTLRVGAVAISQSWYEPRTDAAHFDTIARSLAAGDGYGPAALPPFDPADGQPSAFRAPGYPALLAGVYLVAGDGSWTAARLVNAVLSTIAAALIGLVAAQLLGPRAGLAALALAAVHPALIAIGASMQLEPLLMTLVLGSLACTLEHRRRRGSGWRWAIAAGALAGLAVLTRETAALMVPGIAYLLWTGEPRRREPTRTRRDLLIAVTTVMLAVAIVLPWTLRNASRLDAFVPVSTSSGVGLAGTYNETSRRSADPPAGWIEPWRDPQMLEVMLADPSANEAEVDQELRSESLRFMRDNPAYVLKSALYNAQRLLSLDGGAYDRATAPFLPLSTTLLAMGLVMSYALYVLAMASVVLRRDELARVSWAVWAFPISVVVFAALFLPGQLRYRMLVEPFIIIAAAPLVVALFDRIAAVRAQPS